jgi:hypothetical protein
MTYLGLLNKDKTDIHTDFLTDNEIHVLFNIYDIFEPEMNGFAAETASLEERGLIATMFVEDREFFKLTPAGYDVLATLKETLA